MRGIVLIAMLSIVTFISVSSVMVDEKMTNEEIIKALKAHENMANKVIKDVEEMEEEEANVVARAISDVEERDVDKSSSGL